MKSTRSSDTAVFFPRVSRALTGREPRTHRPRCGVTRNPSPRQYTSRNCVAEHSTCAQHAFAPAPCEASHGCDARNDDPYPRDLLASIHRRTWVSPVSSGEVAMVVLEREGLAGLPGLSTDVLGRRGGASTVRSGGL